MMTNDIFKQILRGFKNNHVLFQNRISNFVTFIINTKELENIILRYNLINKKLYVFKNNEIVCISGPENNKTIKNIISEIESKFDENINDVVDFFGFIVSKNYIEKLCKEAERVFNIINEKNNDESLNISYNLDDILDKILKNGINSLSKGEMDFLKNY